MKKICLALLVVASLACFSAQPLFAGPSWGNKVKHADRNKDGRVDQKEVRMEKKWEHSQKAKVNTPREARMDTNQDGVVNPVEARQASQVLKGKADANRDGVVDAAEKQQAREQWREKKAVVNKPWEAKADTNKDGVVDATEAAQARQQFKDKIDLNKDGVIDSKERRNAEGWQHSRRKVNTDVEKKYDGNGDGWIDATESQQMMKDRVLISETHGKAKVNTPAGKAADTNKDGILDPEEAKGLVTV